MTVNETPAVTASASSTTVCLGEEVTLTGGGAATYTWDNSVVDGEAFSPTATATYTVTGVHANGCENTATVTVEVIEIPKPTITVISDNITSVELRSSSETGNQWYENGEPLEEALDQTYTTYYAGIFTVEVTINGCSVLSDPFTVDYILGNINELNEDNSLLKIYPNPTSDYVEIEVDNALQIKSVLLYDNTGRLIKSINRPLNSRISINDLPQKNYIMLVLFDDGKSQSRKIVIKN